MYVVDEYEVVRESVVETAEQKQGLTTKDVILMWVKTTVATVVIFFFLVTFVIQGCLVYGRCMEPNLQTGERVLCNKLIYRFTEPARGDVVVFKYPKDPHRIYIKRVVGLPGETIEIVNGAVFINGEPLKEPYIVKSPHDSFGPQCVEQGKLFVMGDYRDQSSDSRTWGELPVKNVQAKAWVRYWPIAKAKVVR